ncbi:MAG: hypothetical protein AAF945_05265 [Actinomycetota bacterium]
MNHPLPIAVIPPLDDVAVAPVDIETFGIRLVDGSLVARVERTVLASGEPDACAAASIGLLPAASPDAVLHSTSWRWTEGRVVLTYVCCPDPLPGLARAVITPAHDHPAVVDPTQPSASRPSPNQVLHHGIDHLAWLADHHPTLVECSRAAHPLLWDRLMQAGRHRAGQFPHH